MTSEYRQSNEQTSTTSQNGEDRGANQRPPLQWGAATASSRGPIVATLRKPQHRNAIGAHAGGYSVYRALAIAARTLTPDHIADLSGTAPATGIGPFAQWADPSKIVSIDPWGHLAGLGIFRTISRKVTTSDQALP